MHLRNSLMRIQTGILALLIFLPLSWNSHAQDLRELRYRGAPGQESISTVHMTVNWQTGIVSDGAWNDTETKTLIYDYEVLDRVESVSPDGVLNIVSHPLPESWRLMEGDTQVDMPPPPSGMLRFSVAPNGEIQAFDWEIEEDHPGQSPQIAGQLFPPQTMLLKFPRFAERPVEPGDSWTHRISLDGMEVDTTFVYQGTQEQDGVECALLDIAYSAPISIQGLEGRETAGEMHARLRECFDIARGWPHSGMMEYRIRASYSLAEQMSLNLDMSVSGEFQAKP